MCAVTVFCTAKIYSTLTTIRAWSQPLTVSVYLAFALATGATLLAAIASLFGRFQLFQAIFAIVALVLVAMLKFLYWRAIDTAARTHTIEAATGLGAIGSVSQWEVPHTSENFIMKEMGYAVARKHALKLRKLVLLLLGLACLDMLAALALPVLSILAASAALAAAVVERWLFFAEAQHVSTLYYGAPRA
jgi:DMSO reductase anchor subunit